jgi:hypothetical protein
MDQIVAQALTVYGKITGTKRKEAGLMTAPRTGIVYTNGATNGVRLPNVNAVT